MNTCRSCGASVEWVLTHPAFRRMPINPNPDPRGTLVRLREFGDSNIGVVRYATAEDRQRCVPLYVSHFASCAHAGQWRQAQ